MSINRGRPYEMVVAAASAGGISALSGILSGLPADFPLPIAVVQHRASHTPDLLATVLARHSRPPVKRAESGERMKPGTVYLAPLDSHLLVRRDHTFELHDGRRIRHVRSSANPLFVSAARALHGRVIAVVLSGWGRDGTDGVQEVSEAGGTMIAQDEASSQQFSMPRSAIATGCVDRVLPIAEVASALIELANGRIDSRAAVTP